MGQLLFESKGIAKKAKAIFTVCSILMAFIGVFFVILANEKRSTGSMYYDGGYVLNEDGRRGFQLVGIIVIVLGILFFFNTLAMNKSYLRVYENGIKGMSVAGLLIVNLKKEYELKYSEIDKVKLNRNQIYGDTITVWMRGERYGLFVEKGAEKVEEMIQRGMAGRK